MRRKKQNKEWSCELCRARFIGKKSKFKKNVNGKNVFVEMILCNDCKKHMI